MVSEMLIGLIHALSLSGYAWTWFIDYIIQICKNIMA